MYQQPWALVPNKVRGEGGREIDRFRGCPDPQDTPDGAEAWIGSVTRANGVTDKHPFLGCAEVSLPGGQRRYLFEVIKEAPLSVLGEEHLSRCGTDLGILVKYLDAKRDFLLQCHPSRDIAKRYWNSDCGKTECWHVLATRGDSPAPPSILLGFKPGVTREAFEAAYRAGDMERLEAMCHRFPIHAGETYFIPAGMPHALGEGCFVIELQEPTDLTAVPMKQEKLLAYRSESNPLGVFSPVAESRYELRMLESFIYAGDTPKAVLSATQTGRVTLRSGDWGEESLLVGDAQTPFFALTIIRVRGGVQLLPTGAARIGIVTQGAGELLSPGGSLTVRRGSEVFFPCYAEDVMLQGCITLVLCHPAGAILR
jgi:mannose-6-phosphate isomerase